MDVGLGRARRLGSRGRPAAGRPAPAAHRRTASARRRRSTCYVDVASPFAYLGLTQLPALAEATGVTPRVHPILLGALFRDIGQVDVPLFAMTASKQRYVDARDAAVGALVGRAVRYAAQVPAAHGHRAAPAPARGASRGRRAARASRSGARCGPSSATSRMPATLRGVLADCGLPRRVGRAHAGAGGQAAARRRDRGRARTPACSACRPGSSTSSTCSGARTGSSW